MDKYIKELKAYCDFLLKDEDRCKQFFINVGIHDKDGNLTKEYGGNV